MLGDRLVARVDLKADRQAGVLRVQSAFAEAGVDRAEVAAALAEELALMAAWLELDTVAVGDRGDLAPDLVAAGPVRRLAAGLRAVRGTGSF
nr:crosslink repair DNA glycosylase YcaQ family protein [Geodermatophilus sabuli]